MMKSRLCLRNERIRTTRSLAAQRVKKIRVVRLEKNPATAGPLHQTENQPGVYTSLRRTQMEVQSTKTSNRTRNQGLHHRKIAGEPMRVLQTSRTFSNRGRVGYFQHNL
jgi:hypothetical protein